MGRYKIFLALTGKKILAVTLRGLEWILAGLNFSLDELQVSRSLFGCNHHLDKGYSHPPGYIHCRGDGVCSIRPYGQSRDPCAFLAAYCRFVDQDQAG